MDNPPRCHHSPARSRRKASKGAGRSATAMADTGENSSDHLKHEASAGWTKEAAGVYSFGASAPKKAAIRALARLGCS